MDANAGGLRERYPQLSSLAFLHVGPLLRLGLRRGKEVVVVYSLVFSRVPVFPYSFLILSFHQRRYPRSKSSSSASSASNFHTIRTYSSGNNCILNKMAPSAMPPTRPGMKRADTSHMGTKRKIICFSGMSFCFRFSRSSIGRETTSISCIGWWGLPQRYSLLGMPPATVSSRKEVFERFQVVN